MGGVKAPLTRSAAKWYLAGIIDGEGHVRFTPRESGLSRDVTIYNTDEGILDAARGCLRLLGVEWNEYTREHRKEDGAALGNKRITCLSISYREGLEILAKLPLQCGYKHDALRAILDSYPARRPGVDTLKEMAGRMTQREMAAELGVSQGTIYNWLSEAHWAASGTIPVTKEQIEFLYHAQGLSITATAAELGHPPATVANWMQKLGIARRPAGRRRGQAWSEEERLVRTGTTEPGSAKRPGFGRLG